MTQPYGGLWTGIARRESVKRWRLLLPEHHCTISRAWIEGETVEVWSVDAWHARAVWARWTGRDVEQCSVVEVT